MKENLLSSQSSIYSEALSLQKEQLEKQLGHSSVVAAIEVLEKVGDALIEPTRNKLCILENSESLQE